MADAKTNGTASQGDLNEETAPKPRRAWHAPLVIQSTISRQTNKLVDYLPEGKVSSFAVIS